MTVSLVEVLTRTEAWLRERGVDSPRLDAELILGKHLGLDRLQIYLRYDQPLTEAELAPIRADVARRGRREPIAWILGERGFHEIVLRTPPDVLVPRPDTETLVEAALEWLPEGDTPVYVADVGTGTGAVGLALAAARPSVRVYAIDLSPEALDATRINRDALGLADRVAVLRGDLLGPVPASRAVDWVVSNPPYIRTAELAKLQPEVAVHEPRLALDGGADGLDVYRRLVPAAASRVRQGILLEVGYDQAEAVSELCARAGLTEIRTWQDLAGVHRVVGGRTP